MVPIQPFNQPKEPPKQQLDKDRTQVDSSLPKKRVNTLKTKHLGERSLLTCFEMTSGERGVSFVKSMSILGIAVSSSASSSDSDSSPRFWSVSSPGMIFHEEVRKGKGYLARLREARCVRVCKNRVT
jgi:hypothetical protein